MRWRWMAQVFSLEVRKLLSYRVAFWVQFLASIGVHIAIAYYLWGAVFAARGVTELNGFSLRAMVLYYLLVPLTDRMVRGAEMSFLSSEIYDGSLNRYLVYPVSFFAYKFTAHLSMVFVFSVQFALALAAYFLLFGTPAGVHFSASGFLAGMLVVLGAGFMYFCLASCLELLAFWADNVWSLLLALRFSLYFLGGGMIPLAFFPDWAREVLPWFPFTYIIGFPIQCFLGGATSDALMRAGLVITVWSGVGIVVMQLLWRRGLRRYTGVGI